jgi:hypothetical protein
MSKVSYDFREVSTQKFAWVEGEDLKVWSDAEVGNGMSLSEGADLLHAQGFGSETQNQMWEDGSVDDHLVKAHFETLVELALKAPAAAHAMVPFENVPYHELNYSAVVQALDTSGVKWAIGLVAKMENGSEMIEVGAKGPTTTAQDVEHATGLKAVDPGYHDHEGTPTDTYGLGQKWDFSSKLADFELPEAHPDYARANAPADLGDLVPWKKGQYGKFIGFPDGYVKSWANQPNPHWHDSDDPTIARDGWPGHAAVADALGRGLDWEDDDALNNVTFGNINQDGGVESHSRHPEVQKHINSVLQMHPGTYQKDPEEDVWNFTSAEKPEYTVIEGQDPGYDLGDHGRRPIVHDPRDNTLYVGQQGNHHEGVESEFYDRLQPRDDDKAEHKGYWGGVATKHYDLLADGNVSAYADTPEPEKKAIAKALDGYHENIDKHEDTPEWSFTSSWVPPVLHHWTEARNMPEIADHGLRHGVYLTGDHDVENLNPDIPRMDIPMRVSVDTSKLDHSLFGGDESEGWGGSPERTFSINNNAYYNGPIPRGAITEAKKFKAPVTEDWAAF